MLQPVNARPYSVADHVNKYMQRNAITKTAASFLSFLLIISSSTAGYINFKSNHSHAENQKAVLQSEIITDVLIRQIDSLSPLKMGYELRNEMVDNLESRELAQHLHHTRDVHIDLLSSLNCTDLFLQQIDSQLIQPIVEDIKINLKNTPILQAKLYQALSRKLRELSFVGQAKITQELALNIRLSLLGKAHPTTLASFRERGELALINNDLNQSISDLSVALAHQMALKVRRDL